jgi:hypothetical protein
MITLQSAIAKIASGERICPRCAEVITVDRDENNIHFCLPAPELAQGAAIVSIAAADCPNPAAVVAGRRDPNLQKAVRMMREKYQIHKVRGWCLIQVIVP